MPLLTYLHIYFIDFIELQYSTLMCLLNIFDRKIEYSTIHLLSISASQFLVLIVAVWPPSSGLQHLYLGYPPSSVRVSWNYSLGYFLVHLLSTTYSNSGFIAPHGPYTILFITISKSNESSAESGISAIIRLSIWTKCIFNLSQIRIWT